MSNPRYQFWKKNKRPQSNRQFAASDVSSVENLSNYGFPGFRLYFPDEADGERIIKSVTYFECFIQSNRSKYSFDDVLTDKYFNVDYRDLIADEDTFSTWEDFKTDLINNSEYCLKCCGLAMHQIIINYQDNKKEQDENGFDSGDIPFIQARIINFDPILQLKNLKVIYYGKLVSIKGTVIKVGQVRIICQYLSFTCSACSGTQLVNQIDGAYTVPNCCPTRGCRLQHNFMPMHSSPFNKTLSYQLIKIQELITSQEFESAKIPRSLDCELIGDLVKSCIPGDDITITGIIKVRDPNSNNCKNKQNTIFNMYLEALSVYNSKRQNKGSTDSEGIIFKTNDYYLIQKIHAEPNLFRFLIQSLCPNIYGHEIVKAGLLLALFGGTKSDTVRAEPHILIVGDPGLGKSQMLRACTNVAPRGVYVCGNTSTSSGLTVTMTRDGGEYALEAGALMLADKGCCCIDEFDKMPSQHASLLEAMEQQTISIAKAGILCSLPARTTILAAANPSGGHYNKAKTVSENLKISSPMLSRFDLIFILLDQANEQLDKLLSKHILNAHKGKDSTNSQETASTSFVNGSNFDTGILINRLRLNGETLDLLPHVLFRKYIAYAQRYVDPQLSEEAKEVLKKYYLDLRKQYQTGDSTPITTRQLHSLIRLTQARAKVELREEATKEDALDVVEIMKHTLIEIFTDDQGLMDKTRSQNGTGMSTKNQAIRLLQILQRKSDLETKTLFSTKEIKELAEQVGVAKEKFYNILQSLNIQGFLLNKGNTNYQLVSADV